MSQSVVIHAWSFGSARLLWPAGTQQCELWTPIDSYNSAGQVSKFRWFGQLAPKTWNFNLFIMAHSTSDLIFGLQFQRSRPCTASMDFDPWWFTPYGSTIRPTQHFKVCQTRMHLPMFDVHIPPANPSWIWSQTFQMLSTYLVFKWDIASHCLQHGNYPRVWFAAWAPL